jgi:hypothetical protein
MILGLALTMTAGLAGCGDSDEDPIVGSGNVTEQSVDAMFVETVRISMPFRAVVYNGEENKVVVRGEDNLIAEIDVVETEMSDWEIVAPHNLDFEQNEDVEIEIPFIDMVEISIDGDISFADDPIRVWNEQDGESLPED